LQAISNPCIKLKLRLNYVKEQYPLNFCCNNKLVYLSKPKDALDIILEDKISKQEKLHFVESAIFFKNNSGDLQLFRLKNVFITICS